MDGRNLTDAVKAEEKKLKERNFLRQFNTNFGEYKNIVNDYFYKRDKEETERLNQIQQPKYIYNNFPLILALPPGPGPLVHDAINSTTTPKQIPIFLFYLCLLSLPK